MPRLRGILAALLLLLPFGAGCIAIAEDPPSDGLDAARGWLLVPDAIAGMELVATIPDAASATDLAFRDHYVYISGRGGSHIVDARDPLNPVLVGSVPCRGNDVGVVDVGARRIMTISWQRDDQCPESSSRGGIRLVDVTDPAEPVILGQVPLAYGSHTHTVYGETGLIYNSAYDLTNPFAHHRSEIVDVSDPANPKVVAEFAFPAGSLSHGCHDILAEPQLNRAICTGITETQFWDTTDPLAPRVVHILRNPAITIHHSAATARDGKLLILGDEWAGVLAPVCPSRGALPQGALWFYDITNVADPKLLGSFSPPGDLLPYCSAHNFNVVEGHDVLISSFYGQGVILVDFSDPARAKAISQHRGDATSAMAAYHWQGAVYVADAGRGLDVMRLV